MAIGSKKQEMAIGQREEKMKWESPVVLTEDPDVIHTPGPIPVRVLLLYNFQRVQRHRRLVARMSCRRPTQK